MSANSPPRFERKQVVHNLSLTFATMIRSYRLALSEMTFEGNGDGVISEAIAEAMKREKLDDRATGKVSGVRSPAGKGAASGG